MLFAKNSEDLTNMLHSDFLAINKVVNQELLKRFYKPIYIPFSDNMLFNHIA